MLDLGIDETEVLRDDKNKNTVSAMEFIRCRLCHTRSLDPDAPNIYESTVEFSRDDDENGETEKHLIVNICQEIWGLRYERHEFLPEGICWNCIEMMRDFYKQRKGMHQREAEMQEKLQNIIIQDSKYRPGLNGNPGVFVFGEGEEACVIVDVDPDQLCETSDDEFLLCSDAEADIEDEEWDEEDEEEAQNDEDVEMPLGMDAAQMALMQAHQTVDLMSNFSAHPKSAFLCQYCDLAFTLEQDCQQHEVGAHDASAPYCCNYCQLRLTTRPALIAHIKELHDADRPYVCAHCNKGFVRRSDLKKHTIVHTGVRPFSCHVCSKSFSRNTNLTKHLRIHSSVKPFVCQKCPRSFQSALELMKHTRSHIEVKPFQCDRCDASFARRDKLLMHQQMHLRREAEQQQQNARINMNMPPDQVQLPVHPYLEADGTAIQQQQPVLTPLPKAKSGRGFRCTVCDRSFQRERDLQRHQALHLDTLHTCKVCGQGFNRREQLHRHELEAHGPSYTCAICCITFLQQSELENHLKVHELQHNVAKSNQEALNAVAALPLPQSVAEQAKLPVPPVAKDPTPVPVSMANLKASAAELSFYSNMIPTMNLGFYSETKPEERNGI